MSGKATCLQIGLRGKLVLVCLLFAGNICAEYPKHEIQYTFSVSNYRAAELLAAGDTSGALVILDNTISRQPENHVALLDRGRLQLMAGNREAASRDFTAALYSPVDSIRIAAHTGLAWCAYLLKHRQWTAPDHLRRALAIDPDSPAVLYAKARIMLDGEPSTDDVRIAMRALLHLLEVDISYRDAYRIWRERVKDRTVEEIRRVIILLAAYLQNHPDSTSWRLELARDRYLVEGPEAALAELLALQKDNPEFVSPEIPLLEARCRLETGDTLAFQRLYWQAVETAGRTGEFDRLLAEAAGIFTPEDVDRCRGAVDAGQEKEFLHYFWADGNPDKLSGLNRRLAEHYLRLGHVQRNYRQNNPYNRFNVSEDAIQLLGYHGFEYKYHSEETTFSPGHPLGLDHRGLLYLRYGPPEKIKKDRTSFSTEYNRGRMPVNNKLSGPVEIWWYDGRPFMFEKPPLIGEFIFRPPSSPGVFGNMDKNSTPRVWGDMQQAIQQQRHVQPGIHEAEEYYLAQFRSADGSGITEEIYQDQVLPEHIELVTAVAAAYDTLWTELLRSHSDCFRIPGEPENRWVAVHRLYFPPGKSNYAIKLAAGEECWNGRGLLNLKRFNKGYLELSAIVLGLDPPAGGAAHERHGVRFIPRPSFRFQRGEKIRVYLEYYNLDNGPGGKRSYREYIDVIRYEGEKSILGRITGALAGLLTFGEAKENTEIRHIFDREVDSGDGPVAESFLLDSSVLAPGTYRLLIEARDNMMMFWDEEAVLFEIIG